tara:strand:- start:404 stop:724 length:321 start_codon:yes stop_codon:yes gene_type:complete
MSFEKTFIVTSLRHPDRVWTSAAGFWADHEPEAQAAVDANETYTEAGKLLSATSTLNVDGSSVTYVKVYVNEEAWNEFNEGEQEAIAEESTVCTFTKVTVGVPEPA